MAVLTERAAERRVDDVAITGRVPVVPGSPLVVGRDGGIPIGEVPPDRSLSRRAATVEVVDGAWSVQVTNANGAYVHLWGRRPSDFVPAGARTASDLAWPRIGLRLIGSTDLVHWVLLESSAESARIRTRVVPEGGGTDLARLPRPLSARQEEVLRVVFAPQLAWPPSLQPARQQQQVVSFLRRNSSELSATGVQKNLEAAKRCAVALGMPADTPYTQPDVVYTLAAAGYLRPGPEDTPSGVRALRDRSGRTGPAER